MFGQKIQDLEAFQAEMQHALYRLNDTHVFKQH